MNPPEVLVAAPPAEPDQAHRTGRIVRFVLLGLGLAIGGYFGVRYILYAMHHETTDNAQLSADVYQIAPQVSGRIAKSYVTDYQRVAAGDTLYTIAPEDFALRVASAEAALRSAEAGVDLARRNSGTSSTGLDVSNANIDAARASYEKARQDLKRAQNLVDADVITRATFDATQATARSAEAQYQAAQAQYRVGRTQVGSAGSQIRAAEAQVALRQAELDNARLTLSYTTILAPAAGRLAESRTRTGQFVQAGQPLTSLVGEDMWVMANFKETQLESIHVDQPVTFSVDAYPGHEFRGKVVSVSPATGAQFSLLPPDNATGNFVKVVQRVPVKIALTESVPPDYHLEAGMNVEVSVPIQ
ncbi:HlyD family secretion protein [Lewinella sp. IMCC34183]|uniref:HlyD family secretion protein n=1 Tax=Lewinella sp. IMCC34183 TaxID=2248762 RepID=UPI000E223493|nr:HlyD family secretion protein [Lewinella sp. IMCC34183]